MPNCGHMTILELILGLGGLAASYYFGFRSGKTAERAYRLSLEQAIPRIGSRIEFIQGVPTSQGNQFRYAIKTTIYNDGGLVASELKGDWKLSSSYEFLDSVDIVRADSLPSVLPLKLEHDLGCHRQDFWAKPEIVLQVDLDLSYLGLQNKEEKYQTTYKFDSKSQKMIQIPKH